MEKIEIINKLCSFGQRQLDKEIEAREFILNILDKNNINYNLLNFITHIPKFKSCSFEVDNKQVDFLPTCFISGEINNDSKIISSLESSQGFNDKSNINFNSKCKVISQPNFYFKPSIAINKDDLDLVKNSKNISGKIDVEKIEHNTLSILVGNLKNPKNIVFCHFDSIEKGAIDDASGVAVCLDIIKNKKEVLKHTLIVFDSNEELSYDKPVYWGHGYREFEKIYGDLLNNCEKILVVDCIGYSNTQIITDSNIIKLAFPIKNLDTLNNKIKIIAGNYDDLMKVYHSSNDDSNNIQEKYLNEAKNMVINIINN